MLWPTSKISNSNLAGWPTSKMHTFLQADLHAVKSKVMLFYNTHRTASFFAPACTRACGNVKCKSWCIMLTCVHVGLKLSVLCAIAKTYLCFLLHTACSQKRMHFLAGYWVASFTSQHCFNNDDQYWIYYAFHFLM